MKTKALATDEAVRAFTLVFETGDSFMRPLREFAAARELAGGHFTAIGALMQADLAFFDWTTKGYQSIPVDEQVEVASLVGNISWIEDEVKIHAHAVLGRPDGTAVAGHLVDARVRPTLELFITESTEPLTRRTDPESGLTLLRP